MILDKFVRAEITTGNRGFYRKMGYDVEYGDIIEIPVESLSEKSSHMVNVKCDYCGKEYLMKYSNYIYNTKTIQKCACKNCSQLKKKEVLMLKYGVENIQQISGVKEKRLKTMQVKYGCDNPMQVKKFKEKAIATNLEKYGYEYPRQSKEIEEKIIKTCMEKYGVPYAITTEDVREKIKQTILSKYGVENIQQSPEIKEKIKNTNLERYGVEYVTQCPEIRKKQNKSRQQNGTCQTSSQQLYLHDIYGGELNYPCNKYNLDIFLDDEQIAIEYDGGGHDLKVKLNLLTEEAFCQKEIIRNNIIKRNGIKLIKIVSKKDLLPSKDILIDMLNISREYFETTEHTWIEFNIDNSLMRNAEHKDGVSFCFGELKHIRRKEIV